MRAVLSALHNRLVTLGRQLRQEKLIKLACADGGKADVIMHYL